jgi:hypothetical protein
MELFKQMVTKALEIDGLRIRYGKNDSGTKRAVKDMQTGVDTLQCDTTGSSFANTKFRVLSAANKIKNDSSGLIQEFSRMAAKIKGNNVQSRQLSADSRTVSTARDTINKLIIEIDNCPSQPIVLFDWQTINPGHRPEPIVLKHAGGKAKYGNPPYAGLKITGLKGTRVTVDIEHIKGVKYGGHGHYVGRSENHVGTLTTTRREVTSTSTPGSNPALELTLPLSDMETEVRYKATNFCSRFRFTVNIEGFGSRSFFVDVKFAEKMENLSAIGHKYIETYTNDDTHPDSHWGRPPLVKAITGVADAYGREIEAGRFGEVTNEQRKLWVNDLSLPWGGRLRTHGNHKWGQNVDISYKKMNQRQRDWFEKNAKKYFDTASLHKEGTEQVHYHCSVYM